MPPVKLDPPKEAIKKVVLHQTDGYSPLTPSTISNPTNEVKSPRPYGEGKGVAAIGTLVVAGERLVLRMFKRRKRMAKMNISLFEIGKGLY